MAQEHFDDVADVYDSVFAPHIFDHYASRRLSLFESLCPRHGRILDYGCGTGVLGQRLIERGFEVFGTEHSANMFNKALARGVKGALLHSGRIPFDNDQFDLVYAVAVFHHLETTENVRRAIHEMVRVTKPGGAIVIWDHNPLNPFWPALMKRWPQDHGDERLVPLDEILDGLKWEPTENVRYWRSGWTPEFVPAVAMPLMNAVEWLLEHVPGVRRCSAHNVVLARRRP
jgi:SAM-dependent methyltransferase